MPIRYLGAASVAAFVAISVSAAAQPQHATALRLGSSAAGVLGPDGAQSYVVHMQQGANVRARASSTDFDTILHLAGPGEVALEDDDDGGGTNSQIDFTAPREGDYVFEVRGYQGGQGRFTLMVSPLSPPPAPQSIRLGDTVNGTLTLNDAMVDHNPVDVFVYTASGGENLQITLVSTDFDATLSIDGPNGYHEENDDYVRPDAPTTSNSRLNIALGAPGQYRITAGTYDGQIGAYQLTLANGAGVNARSETSPAGAAIPGLASGGVPGLSSPAPSQPTAPYPTPQLLPRTDADVQTLQLGADIQSTLTRAARPDDEGRPSQRFSLHLNVGQQIYVSAQSGAFDTFLSVRGPGFEAENDNASGFNAGAQRDYAHSTIYNSGLYVAAPATGDYQITVSLQQSDEAGGPFHVRSLALAPLSFGAPIAGRLERGDLRGMSDEFVDSFSYAGHAGEHLNLRLSYAGEHGQLSIWGPDDFIAQDSQQLDLVLPVTGQYRISVGAGLPNEGGGYTLQATR